MKPLRNRAAAIALQAAACAWVCAPCLACGSRTSLDAGEPPPSQAPPLPSEMPIIPMGGRPAVVQPPIQPTQPVQPTQPIEPLQPPCESVALTIDDLRPSVTLLVDQSGSMRSGYPEQQSEQTRWSIVRQALLDETNGVVKSLDQSIQFGLAFYTSYNGFSNGVCPVLSQVASVTGNYAAIRALYDASYPADDTPTGAAILQIVRQIRAAARKGPEVVLLVTDGDPDTCDVPDPQTEAGQQQAVFGAAAAYADGVDFYVLGISADISGDKLQQLANAGQGKPINAVWGVDPEAAEPFQASRDVAGLTAQLRDILARVPLCEIGLDRDVAVDEIRAGNVVLDGKRLVYGNADGFKLSDPRHLEITGRACSTLRERGKHLTVRISCD